MQLRVADWMITIGGIMVVVSAINLVAKPSSGPATHAFDLGVLGVGAVIALWGWWRARRA